jgi:hypothetical protein
MPAYLDPKTNKLVMCDADDPMYLGLIELERTRTEATELLYKEVNHPPHYTSGKDSTGRSIECIEALEAMDVAKEFCLGNAIKYLWRLGLKGTKDDRLKDAKKAQWYLTRLIGYLEKEQTNAKD